MINNYLDFKAKLYEMGFSFGGGFKEKDVMSVAKFYGEGIAWHTGDGETDPWEWRMRVLEEGEDIAYGKVFNKKSGYITKEWYPTFLAVRSPNSIYDDYYNGTISAEAKGIYEIVEANGRIAFDKIKTEWGFSKERKSIFERAMVELQMRLDITICGRARKISKEGKPYGWPSTVFCTSEDWFGREVFDAASKLNRDACVDKIREQIFSMNPEANPKMVDTFILG